MTVTYMHAHEVDVRDVIRYARARAAKSPCYASALDFIPTAHANALRHKLRYDRDNNIMRDDRLGELSRPSNPSEWQRATYEESFEYLVRSIWSDAVRDRNNTIGVTS